MGSEMCIRDRLKGGRAHSLELDGKKNENKDSFVVPIAQARPTPLAKLLTEAEREAHQSFINELGDEMLWQKYWRKAKGS